MTGTTAGIILKAKVVDATGGVLGSLRLGQAQMSPPDLGSAPDMLDPALTTATYLDFTGFAIPVSIGQRGAIRSRSYRHAKQAKCFDGRFGTDRSRDLRRMVRVSRGTAAR